MKVMNAVAKILRQEQTDLVTGFPDNLLFDPLAEEGVRIVKARTERVAVNMADGFTRASFGDRIGVSVVQHGPGIENAFAGVSHAYADSVPLLVLSQDVPRNRLIPPTFDIVRNYSEITKWCERVMLPEQIPGVMRRAFNYLRLGRPGPVVLALPMDVMQSEIEELAYKPIKPVKSSGDPVDVKKVAKALLAAKLPVIRAGSGVLYAKAWDELRELAELVQAAVFTTMNGKSAFPEGHPLSLGTGGRTKTDMVVHFLNNADLIFAVGSSCTKEIFTALLPEDKAIMQTTIDERDINKDYTIDQAIIGDAKLVLRQLINEVKEELGPYGKKNSQISQEIQAVKKQWLKKWKPKLTSDETPINPYRVINDLMQALDVRDTIVTHDSGSPRDHMLPFYEATTPGSYIGWGKSTTLGQALGIAMGAKLVRPEKTVVAFMGDGAFGMVGMDFETAVREEIPIIVLLVNNSGFGGFDKHYPVASDRYGFNILSSDYCKLAEAWGAGHAEKVTEPGEIIPAIRRAKESLSSGKPSFLEVITRQETSLSNL